MRQNRKGHGCNAIDQNEFISSPEECNTLEMQRQDTEHTKTQLEKSADIMSMKVRPNANTLALNIEHSNYEQS